MRTFTATCVVCASLTVLGHAQEDTFRPVEPVAWWTRQLHEGDPQARRRAITALTHLDPMLAEAVAPMIAALADEDAQVRRIAAAGIEEIACSSSAPTGDIEPQERSTKKALFEKAREAIPALLLVVEHDPPNRDLAVSALASLGSLPVEAIPPMVSCLHDPNERIGDCAARALGAVLPDGIAPLVQALTDKQAAVRRAAAQALGDVGPKAESAAPALRDALQQGDQSLRVDIATALVKIGAIRREELQFLVAGLSDPDAKVRSKAASFLGEAPSLVHEALPALMRVLEDECLDVRCSALTALGTIGPPAGKAAPRIIERLPLLYDQELRAAAHALARIGPEAEEAIPILLGILVKPHENPNNVFGALTLFEASAVPHGLQLLRQTNPQARMLAAELLGYVGKGNGDVLSALKTATEDRDAQVRRGAVRALGRLGTESLPLLLEFLRADDAATRSFAAEALAGIGEDGVSVLLDAAKDKDPSVRFWVYEGLGAVHGEHDGRVAAALREGRKDPDANARAAAAKASSTRLSELPSWLEDLRHGDVDTRKIAAEGMVWMTQEQSVPANEVVPSLAEALADDDPMVRECAATSLAALRAHAWMAVPSLLETLDDENDQVSRAVREAIRTIGIAAAPACMEAQADPSPYVRRLALRGFREACTLPEIAIPALLHSLHDTDRRVRRIAAQGLAELQPSDMGLLLASIREEDAIVRGRVVDVLERIGPDAVPSLDELLHDSEAAVREAASRALERMKAK